MAGESLIDLVAGDPEQLRAHCGGGPLNIARALARLGQPVSFLGAISDDAFSAGFLAWWRHHDQRRDQLSDLGAVEETTRFACLVASRTCEHAGASPIGLPLVP